MVDLPQRMSIDYHIAFIFDVEPVQLWLRGFAALQETHLVSVSIHWAFKDLVPARCGVSTVCLTRTGPAVHFAAPIVWMPNKATVQRPSACVPFLCAYMEKFGHGLSGFEMVDILSRLGCGAG